MSVQLSLLNTALCFALAGAVMALSTYVTLWVGVLSFGTVAFAAAGGYAGTYLATTAGFGLWPALLAGGVAGGIFGAIVSPLVMRLASHWLALATVALLLITRVAVVNLEGVTGGSQGEVVPFVPSLGEAIAVVAICSLLIARLARSRFGTAAAAVREDPVVAGTLGVSVHKVQIIAMIISGAIGGVGGVLQAGFLQYIDPDTFYVALAAAVLASVVLGGAYHWAGAIIGAMVFTGLPTYVGQYISEGQSIASGVLLLVIMIWVPGGLIDPLRWRRMKERRRARETGTAPVGAGA
jgi:branched-chain amino acid transport system permease protein